MRYHLRCVCNAETYVRGDYESDTNATNLDDSKVWEWEGGEPDCLHDDFEIVGCENEDDWDID